MRRMRNISVLTLYIFLLCILMDGCSSEDVLNNLSADFLTKEQVVETKEPVVIKDDDNHMVLVGDKILVDIPLGNDQKNEKWECTVQTAEVYADIEGAELDETRLLQSTEIYVQEGNYFDFVQADQYDRYGLVICDLLLKNVSANPDFNITEISFVYRMDDETIYPVSMPVYFEAPDRSNQLGKAYHFELPAGEEREVTVGWLVDLEQYEPDKLYLQIPYTGNEDFVHYVDLEL